MQRLARRDLLLVPLLVAAGGLIAAELLTSAEVRVVTAVPPGGTRTGGAHHGYALALIGVAMVPMALGAVRRASHPAACALLVLALAALGVVLLVDWPATDDTGSLERVYDLARAHPREGFSVELGAAGTAFVAAAATLLLTPRAGRAFRERDRPQAARAPRRRAPAAGRPPRGPSGDPRR